MEQDYRNCLNSNYNDRRSRFYVQPKFSKDAIAYSPLGMKTAKRGVSLALKESVRASLFEDAIAFIGSLPFST
ncbi:hypothetical protein [Coleofasciculus sp. FACHB-SPT9]|uniref:hypothetical protein n=1 Tax=Cyanophyceae TaxID=3028117 RepID=UPI001683B908|nr:hypothetical protein [Coleofasciculus sp. FACHB-SPT9]MBD1888901.1 hypothetical protein [Coleofasciculus sp. FACHB-SPT9]